MALEVGDSDIITIDNYESKLPKLAPQSSQLFALVDMGSNGIRFSISDLSEPRSRLLPCLYRERQAISLYDALHESQPGSRAFYFSPDIIASVAQTLARFRLICDQYAVPPRQITVFATEAMRTAKNRDEMLQAILKASELKVEILSPEMESLFGAIGARSGFDHVDGLFMDLGGGSVQMTYVNSKYANYVFMAAKAAQSMPFGAARLTDALSVESESLSTKTVLLSTMKKTFEDLQSQFPELKQQAASSEGINIYFCGGGFRGYGSMLMHTHEVQPYPIPEIGGFTVSGAKFTQTKAMLEANEREGKVFGMSKRRRQQFPAIVLVVDAIAQAIPNIKSVVFCSGGNREGVLYMKLPSSIRETNPFKVYPGGVVPSLEASIDAAVSFYSKCLPKNAPLVITSALQQYIIRNTWVGMGASDEANSAKALHSSISGPVSGLPGSTHEVRAIMALTLCARWGAKVAPIDRTVFKNLQLLVGPLLSFWCDYLGTVARFLAMILPACSLDFELLQTNILCEASMLTNLGKSGKKSGIRLVVRLGDVTRFGGDIKAVEEMFKDVGKGLDVDQRVEVAFS